MSLVKESDKLYIYKYVVDEFKLVNGPSTISLGPINIAGLTIEHDYATNLFPFFKVTLNLNPITHEYIVENKNDIKFKVRILKIPMERSSGKTSMKTEVINSVFSTFMDIDNTSFDKTAYKRRKKLTDMKDDNDDMMNTNNLLDICLFNDEYVSKLKGTVNFVLSSATVSTCIGYIFSKLGIKNVLMSPLENSRSYSPFVMPSMSGVNALTYLDQNFGLYRSGSTMYFGLKRGYILNCKKGCTAFENGEVKKTTFLVDKILATSAQTVGAVRVPNEKETEYKISLPSPFVNITTASGISNVLTGVDAQVVNTGNCSISKSSSGARTKNGIAYSNNIIVDSDNEFVASTYAAQQSMKSTMINISAEDVNIDAFEPNKEFSFIFEDVDMNKTYKGSYKILSCTINFTRGPQWKTMLSATFCKIG